MFPDVICLESLQDAYADVCKINISTAKYPGSATYYVARKIYFHWGNSIGKIEEGCLETQKLFLLSKTIRCVTHTLFPTPS